MSNVNSDRRVEGDWWAKPIPPNVIFGEGFYCETAQIFRHMHTTAPGAVRIGDHVSCYAGCSFALGKNGTCSIGDFTLVNGALIMAEERIEIGSHCLISWNVGIADSDFHPIEPAQRLIDAQALAPFFEGRPPRPKLRTVPVIISDNVWIGMNADDPERRDDRRKLRRRRRRRRDEERPAKCRGRGQSSRHRQDVRRNVNRLPLIPNWTLDVGLRASLREALGVRWTLDVSPSFLPMKRKRLIVMGFMGSCPIAGVIWQHLHYIVGLQRLGHDVFYIEDSARLPYNPDTFEVSNDYDLRRAHPRASRDRVRLQAPLELLRTLPPGQPHRRPSAQENSRALSRSRRHPECLRHPGIQ